MSFSQSSYLHRMTDIQTSNHSKSEMLCSEIMGHRGQDSISDWGFRLLEESDALLGTGRVGVSQTRLPGWEDVF